MNKFWLKLSVPAILLGMLIFFNDSYPSNLVRGATFKAARPFMSLAGAARSFAGLGGGGAVSYEEAKRIIEENELLRSRVLEFERILGENRELKKVLDFRSDTGVYLQPAGVLNFSGELGKEALVINGGRDLDIAGGDLALTAGGTLVGVVKDVGDDWSRIEVASNPGMSFEIKILPLGIRAVARGIGAHTFALELIPADAPIRAGDLAAVFEPALPRSVLLGVIVDEKISPGSAFKEARATLVSRPEALDTVYILRASSGR